MQLLEIVQTILQSKTLTPAAEAEINQILRQGEVPDLGMQALEVLLAALRDGHIERRENLDSE